MLYSMKLKETTAAAPRVVDAHGLLHLRASKAAKACDAADAVDGLAILGNPTLKLAAVAYGVSIGSVARALKLTPEQRDAVRQGKRALLPRAPSVIPAVSAGAGDPAGPAGGHGAARAPQRDHQRDRVRRDVQLARCQREGGGIDR